MKYDLEYNGMTGRSQGLLITKRPNIPSPQKRVKEIEVPGRDGILILDQETYEPIRIIVSFNFSAPETEWMDRMRVCRQWLLGKGDRRLVFSDCTDYFYLVQNVEMQDAERTVRKKGEFEVTFLCQPYQYLISGMSAISPRNSIYNIYNTSHPVYHLSGSGECALTVNGNTAKVLVDENTTIDTEKMICLNKDGAVNNAAMTGEYQSLYLLAGENPISFTEGFVLEVTPCWRCL